MAKKKNPGAKDIEPGMVVEATKGDLGEEDVSKPKVTDVVEDQDGNVEKLVVEKGVVFKKKLEIPANRIQSVDQKPDDDQSQGKVTVEVGKEETRALSAVGAEELPPEKERNLPGEVERNIPIAEGVRVMEASNVAQQTEREYAQPEQGESAEDVEVREGDRDKEQTAPEKGRYQWLHILGPGFLSGMAGTDPAAVTAYS